MGLFRRRPKDGFKQLAKEQRDADDTPWFASDDDGPELEVETGIGSNLRRRERSDEDEA